MSPDEELVLAIRTELLRVISPEKLEKWWHTPLPHFDNLTGEELINYDEGEELLMYVKTYTESDFS